MEPDTVINEKKSVVLTPLVELFSVINQRYNSNPNSLAGGGYREILKMREQFERMEGQFMNAAYTMGYEKAIEDIREAKQIKPENNA
jgi:hypothetical protein